MVPPTFGTLAKKFHVTPQKASYFTTCYILFTGIVPLLVTPFVNIYGRRLAYLVRDSFLAKLHFTDLDNKLFTLISIGSNIGSAKATTYAGMIVSRCFVGVGSSVALAIGGATVWLKFNLLSYRLLIRFVIDM
jgi:MFS family permease